MHSTIVNERGLHCCTLDVCHVRPPYPCPCPFWWLPFVIIIIIAIIAIITIITIIRDSQPGLLLITELDLDAYGEAQIAARVPAPWRGG